MKRFFGPLSYSGAFGSISVLQERLTTGRLPEAEIVSDEILESRASYPEFICRPPHRTRHFRNGAFEENSDAARSGSNELPEALQQPEAL